jgi:hypothetical protein
LDQIGATVREKLHVLQNIMFERAQERLKAQWHTADQLSVFGPKLAANNGLYQTGWCQSPACEKELKQFGATTRCLLKEKTVANCFHCGVPSIQDVLVARAY